MPLTPVEVIEPRAPEAKSSEILPPLSAVGQAISISIEPDPDEDAPTFGD